MQMPRAQWAERDCRCPWPWPLQGDHPAQDCPHHIPGGPVTIAAHTGLTEHPCPGQPRCSYLPVHHHLSDGCCSSVYSAGGRLLDPFDVARTGVWLVPARLRRKAVLKRRRRRKSGR